MHVIRPHSVIYYATDIVTVYKLGMSSVHVCACVYVVPCVAMYCGVSSVCICMCVLCS